MCSKDESFYFTLITIRVQDCLFRVPRHGFEEHSEVFRNMFSMPKGCKSVDDEGGSDENPIRLDGVDKQSFKDFLTILYPPPGGFSGRKATGSSQGGYINTWRIDKWLSILRLAHMWEFTEIRNLAIANLERIGSSEVQKIEITHKFDIQEWYMPAYKALVKRAGALSVEEANRLGYEFSIKLAGIRERWVARTSGSSPSRNRWRRSGVGAPDAQEDPDEVALESDIINTFKVSPPQKSGRRSLNVL